MNPATIARIIQEGRMAAHKELPLSSNPYEPASEKSKYWLIGYND